MEEVNFSMKRPAGLNKVMKAIEMKDKIEEEVYVDFLKRAKQSFKNHKGLTVKLSYDSGAKPDVTIRTCSLCCMFFFYTKVQSTFQKVGKSAPYEEAERSRESLSFYELLLLCRDFRIIPKIITKEELYYLWRVMNVQKGKIGGQVCRLISFDDFKGYMARIALFAFNKPGIRRIILNGTDGHMPSAPGLIEMLIKYLHLDDIEWVRNRVRTVGKATVTMINSRCFGEKNVLTKSTLRDDLNGTRLSKLLSKEPKERKSKSLEKFNDSLGSSNGNLGAKTRMGLQNKNSRTPLEDTLCAILKDIELIEHSEALGQEYEDDALRQFSVHAGIGFALMVISQCHVFMQDDMNYSMNLNEMDRKNAGIKHGNLNVSAVQQEALDQFDPSLSSVFDPYSDIDAYSKNKNRNFSAFDNTEAAATQNFLDLGTLYVGSHCQIRLHIVNDTPHEVCVNAAIKGNLSNAPVKFTALPNSFCPGLSHSIYISFEVGETIKNASCSIANIITHCSSPSNSGLHLVNCYPVFFRIARPNSTLKQMGRFPVCNESVLGSLLEKFEANYTVEEDNNDLVYNPSSNTFDYPLQRDYSHAGRCNHGSWRSLTSSAPNLLPRSNLDASVVERRKSMTASRKVH